MALLSTEMFVSEWESHQIAILDFRGQRIQTFGSCGGSPEQMNWPAGIAIDDMDNIYVSSQHKLQKFTSSGELIKCFSQWSTTLQQPGVPLYSGV